MSASARSRRSKAASPPDAGAPATTPPKEGGSTDFVAKLVPLDAGFYAFSLAADTGWRESVVGLALPAIHVCAPPHSGGAIEITDSFGRTGAWLGGRRKTLFVKSPAGGGAALVTAYLARDPDDAPLEVEIRRISAGDNRVGEPAGSPLVPPPDAVTLRMGNPDPTPGSGQPVGLEIIAHIRSRGDVRFVDTAWAGRLGPGLWIEAFMVASRNRSVAAAIEYKGLSASGAETPWLACGSTCGTIGKGIPLVGFAIRQKAIPGGAQFDCEYAGYFGSGATAGPTRNGAPCRSARDNDPLEGMQLRVTPRPPHPPAAKAG